MNAYKLYSNVAGGISLNGRPRIDASEILRLLANISLLKALIKQSIHHIFHYLNQCLPDCYLFIFLRNYDDELMMIAIANYV